MTFEPGDAITYGALGSAFTAIVSIAIAIRQIAPFLASAREVFSDWQGEPARPGVPERPGVMVRLAAVEGMASDARRAASDARLAASRSADTLGVIHGQLAVVMSAVGQLSTNGGSSLRDSIDRIEQNTSRGNHNV
jgi:hypothetical protein